MNQGHDDSNTHLCHSNVISLFLAGWNLVVFPREIGVETELRSTRNGEVMNLNQRLKRLEEHHPVSSVWIWDVLLGDASPDELDAEGRANYESLISTEMPDQCPIEAAIERIALSAMVSYQLTH
jgi:hypothetical protein